MEHTEIQWIAFLPQSSRGHSLNMVIICGVSHEIPVCTWVSSRFK